MQATIDQPNIKNHPGLGQGIHFCAGAALAKISNNASTLLTAIVIFLYVIIIDRKVADL